MELHLLKFPCLSELSGNELSLCLAKDMRFLSCVNHRLLPLPVICRAPALPHLLHPEHTAHPPQPSCLLRRRAHHRKPNPLTHSVSVFIPSVKVRLSR